MSLKSFVYDEDLAADLRREYRTLLALGVEENFALEKIIAYFEPNRYGYSYETTFWLALAETQWRLGRLNDTVKERALRTLEELISAPTAFEGNAKIRRLYDQMLTPAPPMKKLRKPSVSRCRWEVGSLLAYRIVNNKSLANHPCYGKYVLLRIVKIDRTPVTTLIPTDWCDEIPLISVYDWIGDSIPNPEIADALQFTPIDDNNLWEIFLFPSRRDKVAEITLLQTLPNYQPPVDMNFNAVPYTITLPIPFEASLAKRFRPNCEG